ncbi:MAG: PAS domain-containing protein, partial [Oscillospiraceae bacterium]|nr:PAS domain-containing protein [Oscillospiraceae bacterium]
MSLITKPEKSRKAGGKLAARFRNANMLFVVSVLVVMTAISSAMVYTLTDAASKEYVRFYAAETADILSSHLNKEISLVRQAAASSEIIEWFADESNPEKKQAAYNKMMLYADMVQMQGLYFAVTASGNEYSVEAGTPFEDFAPYHVLSPDSKYDRWFFDAINAEFDYILKLDTVKTSDDFSIWIDHKVINNGEIVGVFSSALPFDIIFNDLFGQYDNRNVRGVVIDHQGIIQMDSSVPDAHHLLSSLAVYDASEMNHILDVKADSAFISVINTYLENPEIHFGNRLKPEVIKISDGEFRYVAIAQIPFTNWLTVTSYSSAALFSFANALPLIIAIFLLYIIYAAVSSVFTRRLVFNPLGQLTDSLSAHDPDNVFGIERDDEIGELARETRNSWNLLNEESEALQKAHEYSSLMLDLTPTACALWDEHVNLIDCNKTYVKLFCLDSKQELIDFFPRLIPGHQPDGTLTRELMDTSVKKALSTESGQFTLDFMHLLPNGDELPVEVTIVRVDDGKGAYYATYLRDMREHKRMTADIIERDRLIQEAHNHTKLLLDLTPLSCTLWDKNMQIFDCNNTVVKLFGLNSKQEYKENFGKFLPAFQPDGMPTSDKMNLSIKEAVEKGQCVLEFMHLLPGGESLPVEITVVKVDDGSGAHIAT